MDNEKFTMNSVETMTGLSTGRGDGVRTTVLNQRTFPVKKNIDTPVSVLDIACGTGQHIIALQKHGFTGSGADISEEMVKTARENGGTP